MAKRDFLVEIGTEELPPKSLFAMTEAFAEGIKRELIAASIPHGNAFWYATPRRMAIHVKGVNDRQSDQEIRRLGPAIAQAFDAAGQPTKAAQGFAASCGTTVEALQRVKGPKGEVLQFVGVRKGAETQTLLQGIVGASLRSLPIARRMRWGAGDEEFVRPVHWVLMLFGSTVVDAKVLGIRAGKLTRGHRFHAPRPIAVRSPASYCAVLLQKGFVVADVSERRERIRRSVTETAHSLGGEVVIDAALLDEVTALVEWPVALAGQFDEQYLELPPEVPIATMQDHQRYFPVRDSQGRLMNAFITVANINSKDPAKVRDGNERVVRPRLADAAFFWKTDRAEPLEARRAALRSVTFQTQLGSQLDRSERIVKLSSYIADSIGANSAITRRAAELSKCDLLTNMVGEFPELQGTMGKYYARHDGEHEEVCEALEEQYLPRFAGDRLPATASGRAVALADKLDLIAGIFSIGQKPTGTRDPFGLRRAALGVLRIILEARFDLNLQELIARSIEAQPVGAPADTHGEIWAYFAERLRGLVLENDASITTEMFDAVLATNPYSVIDIEARLAALKSFLQLPESSALAGANKRIANILKKGAAEDAGTVRSEHLVDPAERQLFEHVELLKRQVDPDFARREYERALTSLAALKSDVDRFFDGVMVMTDDAALRANRLGLLKSIRDLFLRAADLSKLPG